MSPEKAASIWLRIVSCIEELLRCFQVEGAKISMSRCRRSHQNGAVSSMLVPLVEVVMMAWMIVAWRLQNADLLRDWRK